MPRWWWLGVMALGLFLYPAIELYLALRQLPPGVVQQYIAFFALYGTFSRPWVIPALCLLLSPYAMIHNIIHLLLRAYGSSRLSARLPIVLITFNGLLLVGFVAGCALVVSRNSSDFIEELMWQLLSWMVSLGIFIFLLSSRPAFRRPIKRKEPPKQGFSVMEVVVADAMPFRIPPRPNMRGRPHE